MGLQRIGRNTELTSQRDHRQIGHTDAQHILFAVSQSIQKCNYMRGGAIYWSCIQVCVIVGEESDSKDDNQPSKHKLRFNEVSER
jgi:hypothetical protein